MSEAASTPTTAAKRRWFRYSLRTTFVAVTIGCLWLGYEWNWVNQRRQFLAKFQVQLEREPVPKNYSREAYWKKGLEAHEVSNFPPSKPIVAPLVLWLFREPEIPELELTVKDTDDWRRKGGNVLSEVFGPAKWLFPETRIRVTVVQQAQR